MNIQDEVRKLLGTESAKHKRLIEYVVRQLHAGVGLAEILAEPYVVNRTAPIDRRALLDEPRVVEAAGDEVLERMRADLEALAGG